VDSLNSIAGGTAASSLGAPQDIEGGEIFIGDGDGECALIYTGQGETSDRVMNLAGRNSTVNFEQAGSGLWKLTSSFVISGYGANKTIVLKGDTAGSGEIGGKLTDPYDRVGKATTSLIKSGSGTWALSGENSYSGPTTVAGGTLVLSNPRSLGDETVVHVSAGAMLRLNFTGSLRLRQLFLDGKLQPAGTYGAANCSEFIEGTGTVECQSTDEKGRER
jgi:autotransporter-associated beta strand protein